MTFVKKIILWIVDSCFTWFTPSWRRDGNETLATLTRYMNNFRPSISPEEWETCSGMRKELSEALLNWNKEETERLTKQIDIHCGNLHGFKKNIVLELAESFFVIMVVFLGIRTYYAQPFRIPTGSMQPSLNGIIVHHVDELPPLPERIWDMITLGSSYVEAKADIPKQIINIEDHPKYMLFTETVLTFNDHSTVSIPSAKGAVMQYLKERGKLIETPSGIRLGAYRAGETIIRARVDAGDMVIVDRVAYHFRKPKRGETFVFDTRGINTSMQNRSMLQVEDQMAGTHYIKRLCGTPGDTIFVQTPYLMVNGKEAEESTIARVAAGLGKFNACGYQALDHHEQPAAWLTTLTPRTLANPESPILREYAALGDNTTNSLDSRYWGPVRQFNIVGPAAFTLWPFTDHWGGIE